MKQWYVLYTKPKAEYQVASNLKQQGLAVFLPEVRTVKPPQRLEPFFPMYLFLNVDFNEVPLSQVQWTPGLRSVVTFDNQPAPIDNQVIELIRTKLTQIGIAKKGSAHNFAPGDPVRIQKGPFRDMLGIFERPTSSVERVQVLLNVLGGRRVQVEVDALKKMDATGVEMTIAKRPRRTRGRGRRIKQAPALSTA